MKKQEKSSGAVSPYHSRLLQFGAYVSLFIIALTVIGTMTRLILHPYSPNTIQINTVYLILSMISNALLLCGGLILTWGITSGQKYSKRGRIFYGGTVGMMAHLSYLPFTYVFASIAFMISPFAPSWVYALTPLYILAILAILIGAARVIGIQWQRFIMVMFVIIYAVTQINSTFGLGSGLAFITGVASFTVTLALFAAFFVAIPKTEGITRIFYATFFSAATISFAQGLGFFAWHIGYSSAGIYAAITTLLTLIFIIAQIYALIKIRRR